MQVLKKYRFMNGVAASVYKLIHWGFEAGPQIYYFTLLNHIKTIILYYYACDTGFRLTFWPRFYGSRNYQRYLVEEKISGNAARICAQISGSVLAMIVI